MNWVQFFFTVWGEIATQSKINNKQRVGLFRFSSEAKHVIWKTEFPRFNSINC